MGLVLRLALLVPFGPGIPSVEAVERLPFAVWPQPSRLLPRTKRISTHQTSLGRIKGPGNKKRRTSLQAIVSLSRLSYSLASCSILCERHASAALYLSSRCVGLTLTLVLARASRARTGVVRRGLSGDGNSGSYGSNMSMRSGTASE